MTAILYSKHRVILITAVIGKGTHENGDCKEDIKNEPRCCCIWFGKSGVFCGESLIVHNFQNSLGWKKTADRGLHGAAPCALRKRHRSWKIILPSLQSSNKHFKKGGSNSGSCRCTGKNCTENAESHSETRGALENDAWEKAQICTQHLFPTQFAHNS